MRHLKNKTRYKSLDKICEDSRVIEIWDEHEDGIWLQLADGWNWWGCSCCHEWTCASLIAAFGAVTKGDPC